MVSKIVDYSIKNIITILRVLFLWFLGVVIFGYLFNFFGNIILILTWVGLLISLVSREIIFFKQKNNVKVQEFFNSESQKRLKFWFFFWYVVFSLFPFMLFFSKFPAIHFNLNFSSDIALWLYVVAFFYFIIRLTVLDNRYVVHQKFLYRVCTVFSSTILLFLFLAEAGV